MRLIAQEIVTIWYPRFAGKFGEQETADGNNPPR